VDAVLEVGEPRFVVDGEIWPSPSDGWPSFHRVESTVSSRRPPTFLTPRASGR
jgi:hypothetical protein